MKLFLSLAVPWVLLWYFPWVASLAGLPWLRLGLAGIIFIAPGMSVSLLLAGNRYTLLSHFISGLALSMFLVSSLGVIGRIAHLPFNFIKLTFFVAGLIALATLTIHTHSTQHLYKPGSVSFTSVSLLLLMIILGSMISFTSRLAYDDFTYLAHLTNWQHSPRLGFTEVIFGTGFLEPIRFWFSMFPMNLALLAEISGLHGVLLLGFYLSPILVAISLLATYNFYEDLLQSDLLAVVALLLQFTFLFLLLINRQPGNMFFLRIIEDKSFAAFALAPIFFLALRSFLEAQTSRMFIFVLLSGWGLGFIHPVVLAYSVFIAGSYSAIVTIISKNYKLLGAAVILLAFIILPFASLRFVSFPQLKTQNVFDLESALEAGPVGDRISYIEGTPFYGFNLDKVKIRISKEVPFPLNVVLSWSYLWLLGLGFLWSLAKLKRQDSTASFIAASATLVLLCAIPYSGWLMGYFVSPRMLWRSPWLFPIGLVGVNVVVDVFRAISARVSKTPPQEFFAQRVAFVSLFAVCIVSIGYSSIYRYSKRWHFLESLHDYRIALEQQAALGDYIEANIEQPSIFLASYTMMNYLPGLSSTAKVVYFRSSLFTPYPVNIEKLSPVFAPSQEVSFKKRMEVLRIYRVQYLIIKDASLKEYYAAYPQSFELREIGSYWLLEYKEMIP